MEETETAQLVIEEDVSLAKYTTFGIGGKARYFTTISSIESAIAAMKFCKERKLPFMALGKGSNVVFDDLGFNGLVILNRIAHLKIDGSRVIVGSGYSFAYLGVQSARRGLGGLEFASGIPATVGGAIYMNAGANQSETKDTLSKVRFVDHEGILHTYEKDELTFAYRTSSFHRMQGIIVEGEFELRKDESAKEKQSKIVGYRLKTQPYKEKTCGCAFQNPELTIPAGKVIEECGLKGYRLGGAVISSLHANFIENRHGASANDIKQLLTHIQSVVKEKKHIDLKLEVRFIPFQAENAYEV